MNDLNYFVAKAYTSTLHEGQRSSSDGWINLRCLQSIVDEKLPFLSAPIGWLKYWQYGVAVGLGYLFLRRFRRRKHPIHQIKKSLKGKVYLITGASAGIGTETVKELVKHGAVVHCLCRDLPKAQRVLGPIQAQYGKENVQIHEMDLCDLASVRRFADKFLATNTPIDCLINNAGVISLTKTYTKDGFETTFQANHLGHFLLTKLLLDRIKQTAPSRIVVLSSLAHIWVKSGEFDVRDVNFRNRPYSTNGNEAYGWSKFENILFTRELARRLYKQGVTVNAVHPGIVQTELGRSRTFWFVLSNPSRLYSYLLRSAALMNCYQGAQTTLYAATADELEHVSGAYLADCKIAPTTVVALDDQLAEEFWNESERMIAESS